MVPELQNQQGIQQLLSSLLATNNLIEHANKLLAGHAKLRTATTHNRDTCLETTHNTIHANCVLLICTV